MYPFRRILIPTDFSTASEWVFDDAVRIAGANGSELIILHIRMTWEGQPGRLRLPADATLYEYAEKQELDRLRDRVNRVNAAVTTRLAVKQGPDPGAEIARSAAEEGADLIVIATHARHHVAHLLIGSTTMKVVSSPPAPVLAIRYGIRKRAGMRRIVVPVYPDQTSHAALDLAVAITKREGGELQLVTVCDEPRRPAAEQSLQTLRQRLPQAKAELLRGSDVDKELVRYADKSNADIIFVNATRELGEMKGNILRMATTPVMVVPEARAAGA